MNSDDDREPLRELNKPNPNYNVDLSHANRFFDQKVCFVATTVYGDINAPEVRVLRDFRDNVLKENGLGRMIVDIYYSGFGEKAANFVKKHIPSTIPLIKMGLDYIIHKYQKQ